MVPGILAQPGDKAEFDEYGGEDAHKGAAIDIVLPGEPVAQNPSLPSKMPSVFTPIAAELAPAKRGLDDGARNEEASEPSLVEEVSLLEPEGPGGTAEAAIPASSSNQRDRRPSAGFEDLDVLPDLEGFSDSFTASEFGLGGPSVEKNGKGYTSQGGSGSRPGQDIEILEAGGGTAIPLVARTRGNGRFRRAPGPLGLE